jgi:hypothetical protein
VSEHDPYGPNGPLPSAAPPPYPEHGYPPADQGHGQPGHDQGYGQPAYTPGYAQPGYGGPAFPPAGSPPPGYGYGYDTGPRRTNVMAILGLVFAFVFSPLGIVFSAIGLSQVAKRRENGRGLAIAGLVLSIVFFLVGVLVLTVGLPKAKTAADASAAADRSSVSTPTLPSDVATDTGIADSGAATGDDQGVLAACRTVIPALLSLEADMQDVSTPDQYAAALSKLENTLSTAASATTDAGFAQQVAQLNADLERASTAVRNGEDPSSLASALDADGEAVGTACGSAGFTD